MRTGAAVLRLCGTRLRSLCDQRCKELSRRGSSRYPRICFAHVPVHAPCPRRVAPQEYAARGDLYGIHRAMSRRMTEQQLTELVLAPFLVRCATSPVVVATRNPAPQLYAV